MGGAPGRVRARGRVLNRARRRFVTGPAQEAGTPPTDSAVGGAVGNRLFALDQAADAQPGMFRPHTTDDARPRGQPELLHRRAFPIRRDGVSLVCRRGLGGTIELELLSGLLNATKTNADAAAPRGATGAGSFRAGGVRCMRHGSFSGTGSEPLVVLLG